MYSFKNKVIIEQRKVIKHACARACCFGSIIQLVWGQSKFRVYAARYLSAVAGKRNEENRLRTGIVKRILKKYQHRLSIALCPLTP